MELFLKSTPLVRGILTHKTTPKFIFIGKKCYINQPLYIRRYITHQQMFFKTLATFLTRCDDDTLNNAMQIYNGAPNVKLKRSTHVTAFIIVLQRFTFSFGSICIKKFPIVPTYLSSCMCMCVCV